MYNIYTTNLRFEQCTADKEVIKMVIPYAVFHFVLSGEGYINGKKIAKNTAFISFEETPMHYYPSKNDPWSYIYCNLRGADVKKAFTEHGFQLGLTICHFENTNALWEILSLYQHFGESQNPNASQLIANAIFLLFEHQRLPLPAKNRQQQHVQQIQHYIDENYFKKITIEEIATKFYLNQNYIRTMFVKYLSISPKQYLQQVRMQRAKFLLTHTEESITLIARSVGYDDALLFSKMFTKYYNISPQAYRRFSKDANT